LQVYWKADRMSKRYVLLRSDEDMTSEDLRRATELIQMKHESAKVILIKGNPRSVIVRTSNAVAPVLREEVFEIGGKRLASVLTSGAIGNLKRRASEVWDNGKVS
jgi:hypothetical protein